MERLVILRGVYLPIAAANAAIVARKYMMECHAVTTELQATIKKEKLPIIQLTVTALLLSHLCEMDTSIKATFPQNQKIVLDRELLHRMEEHYHENAFSWISKTIKKSAVKNIRHRAHATYQEVRELLEGLPYSVAFIALLHTVTQLVCEFEEIERR